MKFTLSWLKDHLHTQSRLEEITDKLTAIGLEVEDVLDPAAKLRDFLIARVVSADKHPNADKLKVCQVDLGTGERVQVVCGAPNAREGLIGVFAAPGTYIPGIGVTLSKAEIRGVESAGMLCSERELELSDEHTGIIELPPEAAQQLGKRFVEVMGLDDPVIEIAITPNRPDCLGVRGIARDLAAAGLGKLKREDPGFSGEGAYDCPVPIELDFSEETADACPVFVGRYVRGVKNGPSPQWLQRRLRAIGLRPINALVDITNYILYDRARPLHVYDADKLKGTIRARLGRAGETFLALDGKEYEVDNSMCVIADDRGVLGLGGVIGGEDTGCTEDTRNVFIESAYFDPVRTAMTGRKTGIQSDARYRFERGIDPASEELGANLATKMILQICGGEPSRLSRAGKEPATGRLISFDTRRVAKLTAVELKTAQITGTLSKLGFAMKGRAPALKVTVPSWRPDVHEAADLVEEVIRLTGVDQIPSVAMPRTNGVARPVLTETQRRIARTRRLLAGRGMVEAVTWSFIPRPHAEQFGGGQDELELANPISSEMSSMRPSLLPGLLTAVQQNRNRGFDDCAIFEIGHAYCGDEPEDQRTLASGVRAGTAKLMGSGRHWDGAAGTVDWADAKADAMAVLAGLGVDPQQVQVSRDVPAWFHPGKAGLLRLGPKKQLGAFGLLHPKVAEVLGVEPHVVCFELDLNALPASRSKSTAKPPLEISDLQPVRRDFAFLVAQDIAAGDVLRAARRADKSLIADVKLFDIFQDESLGPDKKSLAIEVTLQPRDHTLTDDEIDAVAAKVVAAVKKATGGEIRG